MRWGNVVAFLRMGRNMGKNSESFNSKIPRESDGSGEGNGKER